MKTFSSRPAMMLTTLGVAAGVACGDGSSSTSTGKGGPDGSAAGTSGASGMGGSGGSSGGSMGGSAGTGAAGSGGSSGSSGASGSGGVGGAAGSSGASGSAGTAGSAGSGGGGGASGSAGMAGTGGSAGADGGARTGVIYVDDSAPAGGDGFSWATALRTVHEAMAIVLPGEQVWIAEGTYRPSAAGATILDVGGSQEVYGGFVGNESALAGRPSPLRRSVLSGDFNGDDDGTPARLVDNSENVVLVAGNAVLDGLVIERGYARSGTFPRGGGAQVSGAAALTRVTFENNRADDRGGAVYVSTGSPSFEDCVFESNEGVGGGGLSVGQGTATVRRSTFRSNKAPGTNDNGGGIFAEGQVVVEECLFEGNSAATGGAIATGGFAGGATITSSVFDGNTATGFGGALATGFGHVVLVRNSSFFGNSAQADGGAVSHEGTLTFVHNSLLGNTAAGNADSGGINHSLGDLVAHNNLFENSRVLVGGAVTSTTLEGNCSDQTLPVGTNTVEGDPIVASGSGEPFLRQASSCLNSANNAQADSATFGYPSFGTDWRVLTTDVTGAAVDGTTVDPGVHYDPSVLTLVP